jgi:hypothetical protein
MKEDDFAKRLHEHYLAIGRKGGATRAKNLTPEQRRQSARKAAQARWSKPKKKKKH